jgi:hypothetical protein
MIVRCPADSTGVIDELSVSVRLGICNLESMVGRLSF